MASYAADFARLSDDAIREYAARRALISRVKREVDEIRCGTQDLLSALHDDNQQVAADTRAMLADFGSELSKQARSLRQRLRREHRELRAQTRGLLATVPPMMAEFRAQQAERRAEADELSAAARQAFAAIQRAKGGPSRQAPREAAATRPAARAGASKRRLSRKR